MIKFVDNDSTKCFVNLTEMKLEGKLLSSWFLHWRSNLIEGIKYLLIRAKSMAVLNDFYEKEKKSDNAES